MNLQKFFERHVLIEGDFKLQDIVIEEEIGRGNSHVYRACIREEIYAMKQIQIKHDFQYNNFLKEIDMMKKISEANEDMIRYEGYFITLSKVNMYHEVKYAFIIMECGIMNLQQLILDKKRKRQRFTMSQLHTCFQFMMNAFRKLEKINIAHCDVKPENILVTRIDEQNINFKLCDVGSSKFVTAQTQQQTVLGTLPFLAPQLVNMKINSSKLTSTNPFKADVFSFGLVVLYIFTFKKFKSKDRIEIQYYTYRQIIQQWVKQARQYGTESLGIDQILKLALQFDEYRRPLFKDLYSAYYMRRKKHNASRIQAMNSLKDTDLIRKEPELTKVQSVNGIKEEKQFRVMRKRTRKISGNYNSRLIFKQKTNENSPSSANMSKKKTSNSTSKKQIIQLEAQTNKIIFVTEKTKNLLSFANLHTEEKTIVLSTSCVQFKEVQSVAILPSCQMSVFSKLVGVLGKSLYVDMEGKRQKCLSLSSVSLKFRKICVNLSKSDLIGGYQGVFKIFTEKNVQYLDINLSQSEVKQQDILYLWERISMLTKLQTLLINLDKIRISVNCHFAFYEKISKLPIKKLLFFNNESFIESEQRIWYLPKNLQTLFLSYGTNYYSKILSNLALTLSNCKIHTLFLDFENNDLTSSELHVLIKKIMTIDNLTKLSLNCSKNYIQNCKPFNYLYNSQTSTKLQVIELKLYHSEISLDNILDLYKKLQELFAHNLQIVKLSLTRNIRKNQLLQKITDIIDPEIVRVNIMSIDSQCYNIYIKRKDKKMNNSIVQKIKQDTKIIEQIPQLKHKSVTESSEPQLSSKRLFRITNKRKQPDSRKTIQADRSCQLMSPLQATMKSVHPICNISQFQLGSKSKKTGFCQALYKVNYNLDNFLCLTCCQQNQTYKNRYYCRWCIENCLHKKHFAVKVSQLTKCYCAFQGQCCSNIVIHVCAEQMGIKVKLAYECLKCDKTFCASCAKNCLQSHQNWVKVNKQQLSNFTCSSQN